ncbi:serine/threonine-protein kinase [Streptomyces sp. NPDC045431]|uniref:serine/threonine-protein kinase n=1 Tax=Streptomyces sp. NPDC045431 TaxID=3155613 RepID=UPI0033DE7009
MSSGENELIAGRYRVIRQLGRGGMGVVWRALDEVLGREVALKELRTYTDSSGHELADLRLRMQREARAAARVRHPGVIAVHDVADHEGRPVIVMELVDGPSLDDVLAERGVMDPREAASIGARVMEALGAAHAVGVLHRDVKPGNVLLDRTGRVVLTDFGIAAMDDPGDGSTAHLTRSGEIVGSLDYLAPERAQGHEPGPPSDIWALGATLYAAVEGSSPFRRTSTWSTLSAIVAEPLPEPQRAGALGPVLRLLMDKDPARRPDAATAARLLAEVGEGRAPRTVPPSAYVPTELNAVPHRPQGFGPPPAAGPGPVPPVSAAGAVPGPGPGPIPGPSAAPTAVPVAGRAERAAARRKSRGRLLVAVATAAVLLAGGGVTYVLMERDQPAGGQALVGGQADPTSGTRDPGRALGQGAGASPSAAATPGDDAEPSESAATPVSGTPSGKAPDASPSPAPTRKPPTRGTGGGTDTGGGGGADPAPSSAPAPAPVCHSIGGGKYNCQVWARAKSYRADGSEAGVLNAGTNYFFCQSNLGRRETHGEWTNVWWAKTDDDSGNAGVWVSDVYIQGGDNDAPVPGLPVC